jgi:curved DNA-binding protein CbpA
MADGGWVDWYKVLEVPHDAPDADIRRAYRKKALATHPDRVAGQEAAFRLVSQAAAVLFEADKRAEFDAERKRREGGASGALEAPCADVDIDDLSHVEEDGEEWYVTRCRCGGRHRVRADIVDVLSSADEAQNSVKVPCDECGLVVRVLAHRPTVDT